MPKQLNELLQDLQDSYATLLKLSILIVDEKGNPKTRLSGDKEICSILIETEFNIFENIELLIEKYSTISFPLLINSLSVEEGGKELLVPIRRNNEILFFIWAGVAIEENNYHIKNTNSRLHSLPTFETGQLLEKLAILEKMAQISVALIENSEKNMEYQKDFEIINSFSKTVNESQQSINYLLTLLKSLTSNIDFIGLAMLEDKDTVKVEFGVGELETNVKIPLKNSFFQQISNEGQFLYLDNIYYDTRALCFSRDGKQIKVFLGYPVKVDETVIGFLFGGSFSSGSLTQSQRALNIGLIISRILSNKIAIDMYKNKQDKYIIRQNSITHVSKVMTTVNDLQQIIELMTDLAHQLVQSKFASFVLHDQETYSATVVKGDFNKDQIEYYFQNLKTRYFNTQNRIKNSHRAYLINSILGDIIECPIVANGKLIGILSVQLTHSSTIKEDEAFLLSLASIGSVIIQNITSAIFLDTNPYSLLFSIMGQWNQKDYRFSLQIKELSIAFAKYLDLTQSEVSIVMQTSLVCCYDPKFLSSIIKPSKVIETLEEYRSILEYSNQLDKEGQNYSIPSQIVALVTFYINNQLKTANLHRLYLIDNKLHREFLSFLKDHSDLINNLVNKCNELPNPTLSYETAPQRHFSELLTDREQDIMKLVLNGYSNKEISEKLYISIHTVKNHLTNIFRKLGVSDRTQIFAYIYQHNLDKTN